MGVLVVSKSPYYYHYKNLLSIFIIILFYCIHTTYEIHSIQFLRNIPLSYYYYYYYYYYCYYNTTPLYILHQHIYDTI